MITNTDMAQVLEDAADLYQAEKVHWCQEQYVANSGGEIDGQPVLTVCATTALGMAAGLGAYMPMAIDMADGHVVRNSQAVLVEQLGMVPQPLRPEDVAWSRRTQALYLAAKAKVEREIRMRDVGTGDFHAHLPAFNDDDETTMDQVVDLFQSVAKDLRNKEEAR